MASSNNILTMTAAIGAVKFDAYDVARQTLSQPGFPTEGTVSLAALANAAQAIWNAGLMVVASGAAVAQGGGASAATMLANWTGGTAFQDAVFVNGGWTVASNGVSGTALATELNSLVG